MRNRSWVDLRATIAAGLLALSVLPAAPAGARDLVDILADKDVITPDEKKEALKTKTQPYITYKEGLGFVFATPDNRFSLAIGGFTQIRYTLTDIDDRFQSTAKGSNDSQTFDVPRTRLWWRGTAFSPRVFYKIEIDVASTSGGDVLRDAELGYVAVEDGWLNVKAGQMKTPWSRQEYTSDSKLEFVDRALATNNFRFERAKGILAYGNPFNSLIEYYAGAFNTTGRNGPLNPNNNFLYIARLVTNPLGPIPYSEGDFGPTPTPLVAVGASYGYEKAPASDFTTAATTSVDPNDPTKMVISTTGSGINRVPYQLMIQPFYNKLKNPNDVTVQINNFETDLAARWLGIDLNFEYFLGWNGNSFGSTAAPASPFALPPGNFNNHGYYAQAGYFIIPKKLQIAGRYSEMTPNDKAIVTKASGVKETQSQDELLGAVSWYFAEHNLKIQSDFGPVNNNGIKDIAGDVTNRHDLRWRVQAQLVF
jgi:phosphate-selective porin OprO/OprP